MTRKLSFFSLWLTSLSVVYRRLNGTVVGPRLPTTTTTGRTVHRVVAPVRLLVIYVNGDVKGAVVKDDVFVVPVLTEVRQEPKVDPGLIPISLLLLPNKW